MNSCPNCGRSARPPRMFCAMCRSGLAENIKQNHPRITLDAIEERHGTAARQEIAEALARLTRKGAR